MKPGDKVYFSASPARTRRIWTVTSVDEAAGTCSLYTYSGDARRLNGVLMARLRVYDRSNDS